MARARAHADRTAVREFKQRLNYAKALSGKGQNEIAREARASTSVASSWFDEDSEVLPGGKFLMRLPRVLGVNGHWLVTGEGTWHPIPRSGRKDVLVLDGIEIGTKEALAEMRGAVERIEGNLAKTLGSATGRARADLADAAADGGGAAEHPARRSLGGKQ